MRTTLLKKKRYLSDNLVCLCLDKTLELKVLNEGMKGVNACHGHDPQMIASYVLRVQIPTVRF